MTVRHVIKVSYRQVLAARIRVAGDRALGIRTPDWIQRLAAAKPPPRRQCRLHAGQTEGHCGPCRSEQNGVTR